VRSLGAVGVRALAVAFTVAVLGACQSDDGGQSAEFIGPNAGELTVGYQKGCDTNNETAHQGDELALGAEGFTPGTPVSLEWNVDSRGLDGSWDGVDASDEGSLLATVELPRGLIDPGDRVKIWAEGSSAEGILALSKVVPIGC